MDVRWIGMTNSAIPLTTGQQVIVVTFPSPLNFTPIGATVNLLGDGSGTIIDHQESGLTATGFTFTLAIPIPGPGWSYTYFVQ
jgi:hypothetical protein